MAQARDVQTTFGEPLGAMILGSASLQSKARAKLGEGIWWVSEKSLQQATPWQVAKLKAAWFDDGPVHDLCCGIGGDAIHLALRGPVTAVDSDEVICQMASANLANHSETNVGAEVLNRNASDYKVPAGESLHIDPDRRPAGGRTSAPESYSPDWRTTLRLMDQSSGAIAKLAPAAKIEDVNNGRRVWISLASTVREQSLLTGSVAERFAQQNDSGNHARAAVVLDRDGNHAVFCDDEIDESGFAPKPTQFMIDPDAAVRAAGLTNAFARRFDLQTLGGPSGFLTGERGVPDDTNPRLCISERVIWHGSCDDRKLRRELRARNVYPARIKTRGVQQDPNKMQKKLRACGDDPITLWIGRTRDRHYAAFTQASDHQTEVAT